MKAVSNPHSLPTRWRAKAVELRQLGAVAQAQALEWCAAELEAAWREWELEALTLQQAADESGYSVDHLGALVRQETIPNAGEKHSPRIRRCDLPRKPGQGSSAEGNGSATPEAVVSVEEIVESVVSRNGGDDGHH